MWRSKNWKTLSITSAVLIVILVVWGFTRQGSQVKSVRLAPIQRGDLEVSINATGTIEPEEVIDVGAQVAGRIIEFGTDKDGKTIDYGSYVEEGTVLAKIDDALYAADVAQAEAQLKVARADLLQAEAKLAQAERDWARAQKLGPSKAISQSDYDSAQAAYDSAKAGLAVSSASIALAEAALRKANQNLSYCTIKSPVSGVIIDRRVNIGQTVVASLNAPSLFLIAKDLKRVEVWVAVNEADIGSIQPGQSATFTVDAFPGEVFAAKVEKIRLNASMTQNVVTYTVELVTDNASGRLLPYLTANVNFEISKRRAVLLVPNSALRWVPKSGRVMAEAANVSAEMRQESASAEPLTGHGFAQVWVPDKNYVRSIRVRVGASDGVMTEIEGPDIKEGLQVVVGENDGASRPASNTKNPFTPQLPRPPGRP